jgi:excisionase family DNA binding protein
VYTPAEAAHALGCSRQTIYQFIARGELRRQHIGRAARIPAADIHRLAGYNGGDLDVPAA